MQWHILNRFTKACSVVEVLPELVQSNRCPPLRAFYEFIIQAVNANVLLVAGEEKPQIKAVAWSLKLHFAFAMIFGVGAIVLGIEGLLIDEIQIPRRVDEILLGIVAMSVALSLGIAGL